MYIGILISFHVVLHRNLFPTVFFLKVFTVYIGFHFIFGLREIGILFHFRAELNVIFYFMRCIFFYRGTGFCYMYRSHALNKFNTEILLSFRRFIIPI